MAADCLGFDGLLRVDAIQVEAIAMRDDLANQMRARSDEELFEISTVRL